MKQKKLKKTIGAATIVFAVSAGAVAGVYAYQSGNNFEPDSQNRDLKTNQVSFSDNTDIGKKDEKEKKDNSALWEKNQEAHESNRPMTGEDPSYLFENNLPQDDGSDDVININDEKIVPETATVNPQGQNPNQPQQNESDQDNVYDIVDNESDADIRIDRPTTDQPSDKPSDGETTNKGDNQGTDESGDKPGGNRPSDSDQPAETEKPSRPGKPDEPSTPDQPSTPVTPDQPSKPKPSNTAKDPETSKPKPGIADIMPGEIYKEDTTGSDTSNKDMIAVITQSVDKINSLYKGKTVSDYDIYCALDTYVMNRNDITRAYIWDATAYNKYVRIDAISFDGETWNSQFPVKIPDDLENTTITIKASYRLKMSDDWTQMDVEYIVEDSRIFILSKQIENENEILDTANMLNDWDQYKSEGTILNMYNYQYAYLTAYAEDGILDKLFPGWEENGKPVSWKYTVTTGRHILEPMDFVDLDDDYTVEGKYYWMSDDAVFDPDGGNYCWLQTLTGVTGDEISTRSTRDVLDVPEYVQVVEMSEPLTVDTLEIPDTVLYVNTESGLNVLEAYDIDEDNPNYASEDGVLYNKAQTEMIGIPQQMEKVEIGENIKKIVLSENNEIRELDIDSTSLDTMPSIDFTKLDQCKVVVRSDAFDEFIAAYGEKLTVQGNCVAMDALPTQTFTVKNGAVISNDGELYRATGKSGSSLRIPDTINTVADGAFKKAENINMIMMPQNSDVTFEDGALSGSGVKTILCYTRAQAESVSTQLKAQHVTGITINVMSTTSDGFLYYEENYSIDGETASRVVLLDAPEGVTAFGGTIEGEEIVVDEIADRAFENCSMLQWVQLPENIDRIGYQAFYGCSALQGVMIETTDCITIGDKAFDNCEELRFVASNAMNAVMEDDYDPYITDWIITYSNYFFVPRDAQGYGANVNQLWDVTDDISGGYRLDSLADGYPILYAVNKDGDPTVALRTGLGVPEVVKLPETLGQIYVGAFAHVSSVNDDYTINWEDLNVHTYQVGAFMDSWLSGDVTIQATDLFGAMPLYIYASVFSYCPHMTSVVIGDNITYLGNFIFTYCSQLKSVSFGTFNQNLYSKAALTDGMFSSCDALQMISFSDRIVPEISLYGNSMFRFNYDWTVSEEAQKIRINVPYGSELDYIKSWRYMRAGYIPIHYDTAYLEMWNSIWNKLTDWNAWTFPTNEEVDAQAKSELLDAENQLRQMFGQLAVSEPTDFYPYRLDTGMLTLVGAPSYLKETSLNPDVMGLPAGWYMDYIGEGAFGACANLSSVTIPDTLVGIYSNAFGNAGSAVDSLTLTFSSQNPLTLLGQTKFTPFVFGADESKIHIVVPEGKEAAYIKAWVYALCGYNSLEEMQEDIRFDMAFEASGAEVSQEDVEAVVARLLLPAENRLRQMMGLPQITDVKDMYAVYKTEDGDQEETDKSETEESKTDESETEETKESETSEIKEFEIKETEIKDSQTDESEVKESETRETETEESEIKESETGSLSGAVQVERIELETTKDAFVQPGGTKE